MTGDSPIRERIDRFARGDLSASEARELAQASLDSPELFDELTDLALANAALYSRPLPARRKTWFVIAGLAAAALFIFVMVMRPWRAANLPLKPTLAISPSNVQPVLLADGLQPPDQDTAPVFRGSTTDSRAPQIGGSIVSIEDGLASIDLGSLDGLDKGSELQIFRDGQSADAIGRLQVTAVFRERARGRVVDGQVDGQNVRIKDRIRVDAAAHLDALLEQISALYNRGDLEGAYRAAEQANRWAASANVPSVKQSELWNRLGVLRILHGDSHDAEEPLNHAAAASSKAGLAYVRSLNNLGVVAELRGDRSTAESRYADALQALTGGANPPEHERSAVEANLARLRGRH
jgi:tetratricopeptide (TPR) repeat protein